MESSLPTGGEVGAGIAREAPPMLAGPVSEARATKLLLKAELVKGRHPATAEQAVVVIRFPEGPLQRSTLEQRERRAGAVELRGEFG